MVDQLKFKFWVEKKDQKTGKSTWENVGTSAEVSIEDVSVETTGMFQITRYGNEPDIIPFGVNGDKGRVALITGVFTGKSLIYVGDGVDDLLDVLKFDDPNAEVLGRAISTADEKSYNLLPELGFVRKWKIDSFQWDRQAVQRGMYKFSITLSYVWEENELQLYEGDIGSNKLDNIKFSAVPGNSNGFSKDKIIDNVKVDITIHDLNRATFSTPSKEYEKGDLIKIYCETDPNKSIFFGVVENITKNNDSTVKYSCTEVGTLLQQYPCAKMGSGLFRPKVKIVNPYKPGMYYKLKQIIGFIMQMVPTDSLPLGFSPGFGIDKTNKWGEEITVPGGGSKDYIPSQMLSAMYILTALINVIENQCGLYIWFDNDTGALEYGYIRDSYELQLDTEYIMNTSRIEDNADEYTADYVVLFNSDGYYARSTSGDVSGLKCIYYKIDATFGDVQLTKMAERIANDMKLNRDVFKVTFPAGCVKFKDGDAFTGLGDATVNPPMGYRGGTDPDPDVNPENSVWQIKEMEITDKYTTVTVGSSFYSVFDIFRDKLKRISQAPALTESKDVTTNWRHITTSPQSDDVEVV